MNYLRKFSIYISTHRREIREAIIGFFSVMTSAWFYWFLFVLCTMFLTIPDSYVDVLFCVTGFSLLPSLYAAYEAWYHCPRERLLPVIYETFPIETEAEDFDYV